METESTADSVEMTRPVDSMTAQLIDASPWLLFGGVFVVASLGGLAALLRSGQDITRRQVCSALLNSGMLGLIIAMSLWSRYGGKDPYLLLAVSVLAGFGGATTIDLLLQYTRKKLGLTPPPNNHD